MKLNPLVATALASALACGSLPASAALAHPHHPAQHTASHTATTTHTRTSTTHSRTVSTGRSGRTHTTSRTTHVVVVRGRHGRVTRTVTSTTHTATVHAPMSEDRATAIQTALIKQGYLQGEPTGHWDEASIGAMRKLQGDNNWQTKIVPDSRALIKLGLGPGDPVPASTTTTNTTTTTSSTITTAGSASPQ